MWGRCSLYQENIADSSRRERRAPQWDQGKHRRAHVTPPDLGKRDSWPVLPGHGVLQDFRGFQRLQHFVDPERGPTNHVRIVLAIRTSAVRLCRPDVDLLPGRRAGGRCATPPPATRPTRWLRSAGKRPGAASCGGCVSGDTMVQYANFNGARLIHMTLLWAPELCGGDVRCTKKISLTARAGATRAAVGSGEAPPSAT